MAADIQALLGLSPNDSKVIEFVQKLGPDKGPEVKSYPDVVYFNYLDLGISLVCKPIHGYKLTAGLQRSDLDLTRLTIDSLDVYNDPKQTGETFSLFPMFPLSLRLVSTATDIQIRPDTDGKGLVGNLGEPNRKGGSGTIGIWCEWSKDGILVEFAGEKAKGPHAWDQGKDAVWKVLTLFKPD